MSAALTLSCWIAGLVSKLFWLCFKVVHYNDGNVFCRYHMDQYLSMNLYPIRKTIYCLLFVNVRHLVNFWDFEV